MIKPCKTCGKNFNAIGARRYCSKPCRNLGRKKLRSAWIENNKESVRESQRKTREKRGQSGKSLLYQVERRSGPSGYVDRFMERSKLHTPDTDLTREFFEGKMYNCSFTGYRFSYSKEGDYYSNPTAPSIDRIDSKAGYYTWNVQVVLTCINRMKNDLPQDQFEQLWKALTQ